LSAWRGTRMAIAHAQEAQQLGAQGRTAAAALPDRSQPARLSRACRNGLPLSVFRRKFAKRSCIEQCSPLLARNSGQSQRMIPAMVILGELSDIFGDVQRGVWLEIRLRLRASSKLFSRHFLDRTRAFFGISRRATTKGVSTERFFRISLQISWRNRIALLCATRSAYWPKRKKG
jgi:hypothetical protein